MSAGEARDALLAEAEAFDKRVTSLGSDGWREQEIIRTELLRARVVFIREHGERLLSEAKLLGAKSDVAWAEKHLAEAKAKLAALEKP